MHLVFQALSDDNVEKGRAKFFELLGRLNGENFDPKCPSKEWGGWLQQGWPALRVIAAYPAATPESQDDPHYAILDMDRVERLIDTEQFLRRLAQSLGILKRSADTEADGEKDVGSDKKPRT